jgi:cell division protein FtsL
MSADTLMQLGMMILAAAATYGAIRQDIKNIHEKISRAEQNVDHAHKRIDEILLERHAG